MLDTLKYNGFTKAEKFWLTPIPAPVLRDGQAIGACVAGYAIGPQTVLTKDCSDPIAATMWLDYQYSKDGMLLNNYGVEGVTFYYDGKGEIQYTDLIMKNPDSLSTTDANRKYLRRRGPGLFQARREWLTNPVTRWKDTIWPYDVWSKDTSAWLMPQVTPTSGESSEFYSIMADITTYVEETTVGMIMGSIPITRFDSFVAQLKSMGIGRAAKIQQAALDRYNNR
jgi:putative aldouronate transport system substrate-binding protein